MATTRGFGLLLALLLALMLHSVAADCECGFVAHSSSKQKRDGDSEAGQLLFANMLESKFFELKNISHDGTWKRQQYNVSARAGRGEYGKSFAIGNVYSPASNDEEDSVTSNGSNSGSDGVALVVGSTIADDSIPVAELDTARDDMQYGSYRAGMKLTSVNGTCAAFFWVRFVSFSLCSRRSRYEDC
jgi:hypothetical protein